MSTNTLSDSELWEAIKLDDKKAFDALFERYWSAIYSTAFSYLRDGDQCSEIVHDIFLKIWLRRGEYEILCFKSYLTAAAKYHVFKHLKACKLAKVIYIEDYKDISNLQQGTNCGEENITYSELTNSVETSLNSLPKRCREIFLLSRVNHLSNAEIAQQLGISKRTVENQLTTALHFLRSFLKNTAVIILVLAKNIF
ncbi:MAG TPA: RNA polymerase sigma-70 factor [Segetibacter sp.]|jgi:RNA polymerase sigma-70 factor (ECF subfamily)